MFARRGYNLQSLAVGNSEREGHSRITTVLPGDTASIANLIKQLLKLVYVEKVKPPAGVEREAALGGCFGVGAGPQHMLCTSRPPTANPGPANPHHAHR